MTEVEMIANVFLLGMCALAGGYVGYIIRDISVNGANQTIESKVEHVNHGEIDMVNKPPHYMLANGMESIEVIRATLTNEEYLGWCKGNALKYQFRAGKKNSDKTKEDYQKAEFYIKELQKLI